MHCAHLFCKMQTPLTVTLMPVHSKPVITCNNKDGDALPQPGAAAAVLEERQGGGSAASLSLAPPTPSQGEAGPGSCALQSAPSPTSTLASNGSSAGLASLPEGHGTTTLPGLESRLGVRESAWGVDAAGVASVASRGHGLAHGVGADQGHGPADRRVPGSTKSMGGGSGAGSLTEARRASGCAVETLDPALTSAGGGSVGAQDGRAPGRGDERVEGAAWEAVQQRRLLTARRLARQAERTAEEAAVAVRVRIFQSTAGEQ